jgi:hypothetical protein
LRIVEDDVCRHGGVVAKPRPDLALDFSGKLGVSDSPVGQLRVGDSPVSQLRSVTAPFARLPLATPSAAISAPISEPLATLGEFTALLRMSERLTFPRLMCLERMAFRLMSREPIFDAA